MFIQRQKILLAYLYLLWKPLSRLHITKSLFLFTQENQNKIYDFHPYLRWPFSEVVFLDLRKLDEKKILSNWEHAVSIVDATTIKKIINSIPSEYIYALQQIISKYGNMKDDELMEYVYTKYPYFAINNPTKWKKFYAYDPRRDKSNQTPWIFTIGYEGVSIDEYVNKLILHNIQVLVDVRKNPQSMKYGFSSSRLSGICEKRWITYINIRELWIDGEERKDLNTLSDYEKLFKEYRKALPSKEQYIKEIYDLVHSWKRIALTCFEADCKCCHRTEVANYLFDFAKWKYELRHI